jgi:hypothetical protein
MQAPVSVSGPVDSAILLQLALSGIFTEVAARIQ